MSGRLIAEADALLEARVQIPQTVVYRGFAHETVVLNLETGLYHGLNPIAGHMLDTLAKAGSIAESAPLLAREYERPVDEIQNDLCEFCESLAERGLIVIEPT